MSLDGIITDALQPKRSLPDIIVLWAFSILDVCVKRHTDELQKVIEINESYWNKLDLL